MFFFIYDQYLILCSMQTLILEIRNNFESPKTKKHEIKAIKNKEWMKKNPNLKTIIANVG